MLSTSQKSEISCNCVFEEKELGLGEGGVSDFKILTIHFLHFFFFIKFLHSIVFYINMIDMQIRTGCSIELLSLRTIWQIVYKEHLRCA